MSSCSPKNRSKHATLTRYCRIIGFEKIRDVGEDLTDFGDRLAWGGEVSNTTRAT